MPLFLLGGCAAPVIHDPVKQGQYAQWQQDRDHVWHKHPEWELHGRVLLQFSGHSSRAGFHWKNKGKDHSIILNGALGMGLLQISETQDGASLSYGNEQITAPGINALVKQKLGWNLDVDSLRAWMWGVVQSPRNARFTETGLLASVETGGWELEYSDYRQVDGISLPFRIVARNDNRGSRVKIRLSRWLLHD